MRRRLAIAGVGFVGAVSFMGGWVSGHAAHVHGKVLVPVKAGWPADLPVWACEEIVTSRLDLMNLRMELTRAAMRHRPPSLVVMHYSDAGDACR